MACVSIPFMADYKLEIPGAADQVPLHRQMRALSAALDDAAVTWLVGLPGAGKTSSAAQWVKAAQGRDERCIWYRLDEDDADIARLIDTLRNHPHHGAPDRLPAWSPDYQADLRRFARRFFSQLAEDGTSTSMLTLVFDDCHRVDDASTFFDLIDAAREVTGAKLRLLLVSRRPPPSLLSRGVLTGWLRVHDDLALTLEEATAVAERASGRHWDAADAERLRAADGWMAHVLALARAAPDSGGPVLSRAPSEEVGEFLGHELMLMLPLDQRRDFRLLAELPEVPRALRDAGQVGVRIARFVGQLVARQYFVDETASGAWRMHDLLRDALREQNAWSETPEALAEARRTLAAWVLPHSADAAMNLLVAAGDVDGALALLERQARHWLAHGRHAQVLAWLAALDGGDDPKAMLWEAEALLPSLPEKARPLFARVRTALVARWRAIDESDAPATARRGEICDDAYRAWCGEVASYVVQWGAVQGLADLVDELESLQATLGPARGEWQFRTSADALTALMYGRAEDARIRSYARATAEAVQQAPDADSRIVAAAQLLIYQLWWAGDFAAGRALYNTFDDEVDRGVGIAPLTRLIWWSNAAIIDWQCGEAIRCYGKVDRGLELAEATGVHVRDFFLLTQGIFCALANEDWPRAEVYLAQLARTEREHKRLDAMVHHFFRSWYALSRGDAATALAHAQTAWPMAESLGSLFHKVIVLSALAPAALHSGDVAGAVQAYRQQLSLAKLGQNPCFGYIAFCAGAEIALATGDHDKLRTQLERMLATKAMSGFHSDCGWRTPMRARLFAFALENAVMPDVARQWILEKRIPAPPGFVGEWPVPVQVTAIGALAVTIDGRPAHEGVKSSGRLRDLLAILVVERRGATQVDLCDWLWPDADGDKAAASLKAAVHRLRAWLGTDAIVVRNAMVTLNPLRVGCDLWRHDDRTPHQPLSPTAGILVGSDAAPVVKLRRQLAHGGAA